MAQKAKRVRDDYEDDQNRTPYSDLHSKKSKKCEVPPSSSSVVPHSRVLRQRPHPSILIQVKSVKKITPAADFVVETKVPESCSICSSNPFHPSVDSGCRFSDHLLSPHRLKKNDASHLVVKINDVIDQQFHVVQKLGEGTFGQVFCIKDLKGRFAPPDRLLAIKITKDNEEARQDMAYETNVLKSLLQADPAGKHLFVKMYHSFEYHGHPCIVMEKLGWNIRRFLDKNNSRPFQTDQLRQIAYQICYALEFLHRNKLTHTDLKTDNIVFLHQPQEIVEIDGDVSTITYVMENPQIRLVDFGSAVFDHEYHGKTITTIQYRAPEIHMRYRNWSQPVDVWSIGCILLELYTGSIFFAPPSTPKGHLHMMERVLGKIPPAMLNVARQSSSYKEAPEFSWDSDEGRDISSHRNCKSLSRIMRDKQPDTKLLFDLIKKMLTFSPLSRVRLAAALNHEYFRSLKSVQKLQVRQRKTL